MQCLVAARRKVVVWVLLARQFPVQLEHAPLVALQVLFVLGIDSAQLAIECVLEEEWVDEELCEAVEGAV